MSEMRTVEVEFNDEEILIEALKKMGYEPQIHNEGIKIDTYYGNEKNPTAHIVIPKSQIKGYSAVGFERHNGKFRMHMDSMDGQKFGENKLKQYYSEAKIMKVIKHKHRYTLSYRKEEKGQIKIGLRVNY